MTRYSAGGPAATAGARRCRRRRSPPAAADIGPGGTSAAAAVRGRAAVRPARPRRLVHSRDQALLHRLEHRLAAGMDLELAVDVLDVAGHGLARQAEMAGDLGVAEALGDAPEDVDLARRQFGGVERGARRRLGVFWVRRTMKRAIEAEIGECPATRSRTVAAISVGNASLSR